MTGVGSTGAREGARQRAERLAQALRQGDRLATARAISEVEDSSPAGLELLDLIYPHTGRARCVGITGPPGSGKSTLVHVLAMHLRRREKRVAVLAVDPTSPFSGGAILGDRVRMPGAAGDEGFFVRSMASRGSLGGVSTTTREASEVLDAAGFDWILIETVGVGQSELEIVELADTVVLVLVPESGDAVQVMKAGIMEIADLFVVNKYDREGGDRLMRDISVTMEITQWSRPEGWVPPICPTAATTGEGIEEVLAATRRHLDWLHADRPRLERFRAEKLRRRLRMLLSRVLLERAWEAAQIEDQLDGAVERILAGEISPYRWAAGIELG